MEKNIVFRVIESLLRSEIMLSTLEGAGPFFYEGDNNIGIIFLHGGGGGTCADLKEIAEDLNKMGNLTVSVPLLPGYGTTPEDLRKSKIKEWKNAIKNEIVKMKDRCKYIFIGGHSMGGVLALIFAATTNDLSGLFTISAPIGIKSFASKLAPLFNIFLKYHQTDWQQFKEETNGKWVGYKKIPLNIVNKINKLISEMKRLLPNIKIPALIMQGKKDSVIKRSSLYYILDQISSEKKQGVWLENNDHPILMSPDHDIIVSELMDFIKNVSTSRI